MDQILTNALAEIKNLAFFGFGALEPVSDEVFWWATSFAVFFMLFAWIIRPTAAPVQMVSPWTSLLILMYVVAIVMRDFVALTSVYINFMSEAGIHAAGGGPQHGLEDISAVLESGWDASAALWMALNGFSLWTQTGSFFLLVVCIIFILFGHVLLAYRLIKLFGEFYLLSVIAFFCLPFMVWRQTLFLGEGPAKYIIATGLSVMAIGFGYGLTHAMVGQIVFDPSMQATDYFYMSVSMLILLLVVAGLPAGIKGMISGSANTSFSNEARDMMFAASTAAGGARMAMAMAPAAGAAVGGGAGGGGSSLPGGISFNSGWQPSASSGSGRSSAFLSDDSGATRI